MSLQSKAFSHPCRRSVPRRPLRAAPPPSPASDLFPHPEGEIRRYSFPALAIRCERELLEVQQAEDMKEILSNVSASVDAFASLMELMDAEAKVDGVIIHFLGDERPWIRGNHNHYVKWYRKYLAMTPWKDMPMQKGKFWYMQLWWCFNQMTRVCPALRLAISKRLGMKVIDNRKKRQGKKK